MLQIRTIVETSSKKHDEAITKLMNELIADNCVIHSVIPRDDANYYATSLYFTAPDDYIKPDSLGAHIIEQYNETDGGDSITVIVLSDNRGVICIDSASIGIYKSVDDTEHGMPFMMYEFPTSELNDDHLGNAKFIVIDKTGRGAKSNSTAEGLRLYSDDIEKDDLSVFFEWIREATEGDEWDDRTIKIVCVG